jgi:hypothetical protein
MTITTEAHLTSTVLEQAQRETKPSSSQTSQPALSHVDIPFDEQTPIAGSEGGTPTVNASVPPMYKPHPLCALFPAMRPCEFDALLLSAEMAGGITEKIVLYEGMILDGWHRYKACIEKGLTPSFEQFEGPGNPEDFVIDKNVARRHMSDSQSAMVAAHFATNKPGRPSKTSQIRGVSLAESARRFGIGETSVLAARKVWKQGVPELVDAVRNGEVAVSKGAEIAQERPERQEERLAELRDARAQPRPKKTRSTDPTRRKRDGAEAADATADGAGPPQPGHHRNGDLGPAVTARPSEGTSVARADHLDAPDTTASTEPEDSQGSVATPDDDTDGGGASDGVVVVDTSIVWECIDHCRALDETMPEVVAAVGNGLDDQILADLAKYVSRARTALFKITEALERSKRDNDDES